MLSADQHTVSSPPFCRPTYFMEIWDRPKVINATRSLHLLKTLVLVKFRKLFEGWLLRKHKKRALLIGIRHYGDPSNTESLAGPHRDVQSLKRLLISERCHIT